MTIIRQNDEGRKVGRVSRRSIRRNITLSSNPPIDLIDVKLLKKLKVRKTKDGWVAEIPKSERIKNIKAIKNNLSLLFKNSRDGDLETIERVVKGEIYPVRYTQNLMVKEYRRLTMDKKWNIGCGDLKGKTEALKSIITDYKCANPSRDIFVLVPNKGCGQFSSGPAVRCITTPRDLRRMNKDFKNKPWKAILFSDNVKNAQVKLRGLWNIEYRGGFYGNNGVNL